jgi:hypothetical protein
MKNELEIFWVDPYSLNESEYNPRKITPKKKKELRDSLVKYGLRDPLKVNTFEGRENILISGHQRLKIAKELGHKLVPVTYEYLNLDDEKEMNLRWNKNGGEFDLELVNAVADREILLDIGFSERELISVLSEFEQKFEEIDTSDPVYPIAPKFNEKYDYVMIFCKTELDFTWLKNLLEIKKAIDYKSKNMGECRVIMVEEFQKLYEKWTSK